MDRTTETITGFFPRLKEDSAFLVTSPKDAEYNCVAWAAERKDVWMWPISPDDDEFFWPKNIQKSLNEDSFVEAFANMGYTICPDNTLETGYMKIAIYSIDGEVTHVARQLPNGHWTSKLGWLEDIQHGSPQSLEGDLYGTVCCYMKKPLRKH